MATLHDRTLAALDSAHPRDGVTVFDASVRPWRTLAHRDPVGDGGAVMVVLDDPDTPPQPAHSVSRADVAHPQGVRPPSEEPARGGLTV